MSILSDGEFRLEIDDARTGDVHFIEHGAPAYVVEWHPGGDMVAIPDVEGNVRLVRPDTGVSTVLGRHKRQAVMAAFSPDGRYLVSGGWEAELICWDLQTMQRAFTIGLNSWRLRFRGDGRQCMVDVSDRIQVFDFQTPDGIRDLPWGPPARGCLHGAFATGGRWFAANREEGVAVWDLENRGPAAMALIEDGTLRMPLFTPSGSELFAYTEGKLMRWQLSPGETHKAPVLTGAPIFNPPGFRSAFIRENELVFNGDAGVHFLPLDHPDGETVRHLVKAGGWGSLSPDERWMGARVEWNPGLAIFQMPEVERVALLTNRADVWTFAFSPQGDELAVATRAGLEFYSTKTWERTRELTVPGERQSSIIYTPDGKTLWHTSDGRTAALRDARTLEILLPLPAGTRPLALSSDGRKLAVSVDTSLVQIWDLDRIRNQLHELGVDWAQE
jgi:hypothetical protein